MHGGAPALRSRWGAIGPLTRQERFTLREIGLDRRLRRRHPPDVVLGTIVAPCVDCISAIMARGMTTSMPPGDQAGKLLSVSACSDDCQNSGSSFFADGRR
jgi:hypothetical protein